MRLISGLLAAAALLGSLSAHAYERGMQNLGAFGDNPGRLEARVYVPESYVDGNPVVVALHGCTQRVSDYDDEPGWTHVAERFGLLIVFPQQREANNMMYCFNWMERAHQQRGAGEPLSIINMVDTALEKFKADRSRVYVAGLSGGAGMSAVMAAAYPDRFAGAGIVGGVPYACSRSMDDSLNCLSRVSMSARAWGDRVRAASDHQGPWPRISIWHGDRDRTVQVRMAAEQAKQWADVHGLDESPTRTEAQGNHSRAVWEHEGQPAVEFWTIKGMAHGTPIKPGDGDDQCGRRTQYALDVGVCAAYQMLRFWGAVSD